MSPGPHLVTINPMHSLSVYAEKVMQLFRGCKREDLPPHIYATAQSAYRSLLRTRKDQVEAETFDCERRLFFGSAECYYLDQKYSCKMTIVQLI